MARALPNPIPLPRKSFATREPFNVAANHWRDQRHYPLSLSLSRPCTWDVIAMKTTFVLLICAVLVGLPAFALQGHATSCDALTDCVTADGYAVPQGTCGSVTCTYWDSIQASA